MVFGNDFDHPIRDRLPPGFGTAFKIVKWVVDPGLEGDFYADKPFLYGGLGGSVNSLFIGDESSFSSQEQGEKAGEGTEVEGGSEDEEEGMGRVIREGGTEQGMGIRAENGIPDSEAGRKKFFLNDSNKKAWTWEGGREYGCDFFNPYLDFNGMFPFTRLLVLDERGLRKDVVEHVRKS